MSFGVDLYKNLVIMLNFLPHSANRTEYEEVACMVLNLFDLGLRETMDMCLSGVFFGEISCNPSFQLNSRITRENGGFYQPLISEVLIGHDKPCSDVQVETNEYNLYIQKSTTDQWAM